MITTPSAKCPTATSTPFATLPRRRVYMNDKGDRLRFSISANRFLGRMVRIITGKLIDIGTGTLSVDEFEHYLIHPQETQLIKPAYPQGLYLSKIKYPYLDIPSKSDFVPDACGGVKVKYHRLVSPPNALKRPETTFMSLSVHVHCRERS
jgi:hypothetical protein